MKCKTKQVKRYKYRSVMDLVPHYASSKDASLVGGEPVFVRLRRFELDRALRGHQHLRCCGCGYLHLHTFDVHVNGKKREWWLNIRSYGDSETWPKKVIDAKGKLRKN
jgi:hypothetical protein